MDNLKKPDEKLQRSPEEIAVITFGIIKTTLLFFFTLLLVKLGYEGFRAGEMGFMVGIFMTVIVLIMIPVCILKIILILKLLQRKKWALIVSIVFTVIYILFSFPALTLGFLIFLILFIILIFMLLLEIRLLKSNIYT